VNAGSVKCPQVQDGRHPIALRFRR
jgi:hypothetical protein